MRIAELTGSGFQLRDVPVPEPGPGQVLVKTAACGVCTGDLHRYADRVPDMEPQLHGHEGAGTVAALGVGVYGYAVGDTVTSIQGAFAEYFVADAASVTKTPGDGMIWAAGEPAACCVHALRRSHITDADRVAVVGCGFMGQVCIQLARHFGAKTVCAIDPVQWRLDTALALGATEAAHPDGAPLTKDPAHDGTFDVVIEAAGTQSALDLCGDLVTQHGRMNIVGYHQTSGGMRSVRLQQWNYKAIEVVNGHVRRDEEKMDALREAVSLLSDGALNVEPLITSYPLEQIETAFRDLTDRKKGLFKAAIVAD